LAERIETGERETGERSFPSSQQFLNKVYRSEMRQTKFKFDKSKRAKLTHGGTAVAQKRKGQRPLDDKRPLHLAMKCSKQIFEQRNLIIDALVLYANRFGIPIYSFAIGNDHIHFLTKIPSRDTYKKFIRALTGVLAKKLGKLRFTSIPFTRIAHLGRNYFTLLRYLQKNWDEVTGRRAYEPRGRKRKQPA
jgi:REP element-mobilizing transposase RayT